MNSFRRGIIPLAVCLPLVFVGICTGEKTPATTTSPTSGVYTGQLRHECDALLETAIKRPYGWGWTPTLEEGKKPDRSPVVSFEPGQSPAAGLVLLFAGDLLNEPRYRDAGLQAARGVAAAEQAVGKFPSHPIFGVSANGREPPSAIADRASTCAGLGLVLNILDSQGGGPTTRPGKRDEALDRCAHHAAAWMLKQQPPTGGWLIAYPAGAAPQDATKLVRLDTPDTRDSTFAMLFAYEVLGQPEDRRSVEHGIDSLLRFRLLELSKPGAKLWSAAYNLDGSLNENFPELPPRIDVLASRYSMQTLLGVYVSLGIPSAGDALNDAAKNMTTLSRQEGQWCRRYDLKYAYFHGPASQPGPGELFYHPTTHPADNPDAELGTFGLEPVLSSIQTLHDQGRQAYQATLEAFLPYKQHLAATITGLEDEPLTDDFPQRAQDVDTYLHRHEEDWKSLEGLPPPELAERVHRIWLLLIRAKIEQRFGT